MDVHRYFHVVIILKEYIESRSRCTKQEKRVLVAQVSMRLSSMIQLSSTFTTTRRLIDRVYFHFPFSFVFHETRFYVLNFLSFSFSFFLLSLARSHTPQMYLFSSLMPMSQSSLGSARKSIEIGMSFTLLSQLYSTVVEPLGRGEGN